MRTWVWVRAAAGLPAGVVTAVVTVSGCNNDAGHSAARSEATEKVAPSAPPSAPPVAQPPETPPPPHVPALTLDDRTCTIDGKAFTGDWGPDAQRFLRGFGPELAGKDVALTVMRDTKVPKVEAVVAALTAEKVHGVVVRTPMRDQSTGELSLSPVAKGTPACSAVAMIEQNGAVAVWSKGGGGAQRFSRGMAGPDLSTSTDALRKRAASCDSPTWFVSAADTVTWGLTFDLAMRARGAAEAGVTLKPTQTVLLAQAAVPGRPVKDD